MLSPESLDLSGALIAHYHVRSAWREQIPKLSAPVPVFRPVKPSASKSASRCQEAAFWLRGTTIQWKVSRPAVSHQLMLPLSRSSIPRVIRVPRSVSIMAQYCTNGKHTPIDAVVIGAGECRRPRALSGYFITVTRAGRLLFDDRTHICVQGWLVWQSAEPWHCRAGKLSSWRLRVL